MEEGQGEAECRAKWSRTKTMKSEESRSAHGHGLARSCLLVALLLMPGCMTSPRSMPTSHPGARTGTDDHHFEMGFGAQMMFKAKLVSSQGVSHPDPGGLVDLPHRIAVLQIPHVAYRRGLSETCDWGLEGGLAQTGASLRCGLRHDDLSASFQLGAHWLPVTSFQSHGELQLGYKSDAFMAFVTAGLLYSALTHAYVEEQRKSLSGTDFIYYGPGEPWLEIFQHELAAQLGFIWGMSLYRRSPFLYMGVSCDLPFWHSRGDFTCHGCRSEEEFLSFDPGLRLGILIGLSY